MMDDLERILEELGNRLGDGTGERAVLIGGWSVFAELGGEMSHDIDFIFNRSYQWRIQELIPDFHILSQGDGMKGSGKYGDVHVDIYFPYSSFLGEIRIDVGVLAEYASDTVWRGWSLLSSEGIFVSKAAGLIDRPRSAKGEKDAREMRGLIFSGIDPYETRHIFYEASQSEDCDYYWGLLEELLSRDATKREREEIHNFFFNAG